MKQQLLFLFITIFTLASCAQQYETFDEMAQSMAKGTVPLLKTKELDKIIQEKSNVIILDAREKKEFNTSHIKGAYYVGYDRFKISSVKKFDKSTKVIVYCSVGYRSEKIGEKLQESGFTDVYNLYGGIFDWKNKGYPIINNEGVETEKIHAFDKSWGQWLKKGEKVYE